MARNELETKLVHVPLRIEQLLVLPLVSIANNPEMYL